MRAMDRASALKPFWRGGGGGEDCLLEGSVCAHWSRSTLSSLCPFLMYSGWMGSDLGCSMALNDRVSRTKPTKLLSALPTPPDLDNAGKESVTHSSGQPLPP